MNPPAMPGTARQPVRPVRRAVVALAVASSVASLATAVVSSGRPAEAAGGYDPRFTTVWTKTLGTTGSAAALASPGVGVLDGAGPSVVFGTRAGMLFAYHVSDGSSVAGWPRSTGGPAVDSTPAVVGTGANASVYVGLGNSARPTVGGIAAYRGNGSVEWMVRPKMLPTGGTAGVQTSVAVGRFATSRDVVAGSMGQLQYAVSSTGAVLPGFPWFQADSNFSTPAIYDINNDGRDEIITGGDSTQGVAYGKSYTNGGAIRIVRPTGNSGRSQPWDAVHCSYQSNQVVQSSPSVGPFLAGRGVGIVVGTGRFWSGASDTNSVFAVDTSCRLKWKATLDGMSLASPSLIDVDGNGSLEVVTASSHGTTGTLYVIDGATGHAKWHTAIPQGPIYGQVTSVDIAGRRSLLVGHPGGVTVYDAATGAVTGQLLRYVGVQNTPTVTLDPGGHIGVTVIGYGAQNQGVAFHFRLNNATATTVSGAGQWPMFHRDPSLRGSIR